MKENIDKDRSKSNIFGWFKHENPIDNKAINYFSNILSNQSHKNLLLCYQEFIAERYGTSIEDLVEKSRAVSYHTLITDSYFMELLMEIKHNKYHSIDRILIKITKEQQKRTVRQILIPYSLSGIWILFSIELYSREIQVICSKKIDFKEISKETKSINNYITNSKRFHRNLDDISSNGLCICNEKSVFDIKIAKTTMHTFEKDSGVLAWLYMYSKYQGILPQFIEQYSWKRRNYLFKAIRDQNFDKLHLLFNSAPQDQLCLIN